MRTVLVAICVATVSPPRLHAQAVERAVLLARLGADTLSVESYTRTRDRLEGYRALRAPRVELLHYVATLDSAGRIVRFEGSTSSGQAPGRTSRVVIAGDSADVTVLAGDSTRTYRTGARPGAVPMPSSVYALYEQMIRQALRVPDDSVATEIILPGALSPIRNYVRRLGPDSVALDYAGKPFHARIDRTGRILGLDGMLTTLKVRVTREPWADIPAIARAFAEQEARTGPAGRLSPRDTVRSTVGSAAITIDYGRPRKRGREIFGVVVPWDQVWRTGANAATGFTTDHDLVIGGAAVPAGSYTLWTLPSRGGATLIINRQTGQWGTDYEPAEDLVHIPLRETRLPQTVEDFTISIDSTGATSGVLRLRWDTTQWEAPLEAEP